MSHERTHATRRALTLLLAFLAGGTPALAADDVTAEGKPIKLRMVWYNIAADELDWNWEKSEDAGQTWAVLWQLHYTRRK